MVSPRSNHYWLRNAQVPVALVLSNLESLDDKPNRDGLVVLDLEIQNGIIQQLQSPAKSRSSSPDVEQFDLKRGQVWPCFMDMHTHLDKGHIWERSPNLDGTFDTALSTILAASKSWQPEDVYRRMEFGLKCSYAHGTQAIRTHLDSAGHLAAMSLEVFKTLQQEWRDRLTLQAVCLVSLDYFLTPAGEALADQMAETPGGVLGGLALMSPELPEELDRVFGLAQERGLDLDFHADETPDPESRALRAIAEAALQHQFQGQIVCGHCCSLAVQDVATAATTIERVQAAGIGVVSLPMCNLYLQDRQSDRTPRWRGVTALQELHTAGVPIAVASDNCRDPFYGFGDHDGLEVFSQAVRIAHLDNDYGSAVRAVTSTPAKLMGHSELGGIGVGQPADLVIFRGRGFSELLSRPQSDRTVLRKGRAIDTTLPDYAELDD